MMGEKDEEALKCLINIESKKLTEKDGFKLILTFKQNQFFENTELIKTFTVNEDNEIEDCDGNNLINYNFIHFRLRYFMVPK